MDFPITGVTINPLFLIGIGFMVGLLGGFFGVGGGFLAGPLMFWSGVPMNFVVGTDLAHMTGKSIVAAKRHRTLGHVDVKLGALMIVGTIIGVEIGAQIIEALKESGNIEHVIGITYIVILSIISAFTAWESIKAIRMIRTEKLDVNEALAFTNISRRVHRIRIWPMVSLPGSGIAEISLWVVLGVGMLTGILAGSLGVGGGFIRMPMLIYVLGVPTHVAVGTDLFEIVFSAGYGTLTHAVKGNVDVLMALVMQTGAAVGAQIGATATRYFAGPRIRLFFSVLPLIGAILVLIRLIGGMPEF
ncbi:MAG: sulfite exporter TauE/SafE family protein [Ardenticatenaceae bacterium]|nr:sulfite exporter TauE/SafE family protein [Anaerolineales bacterium]MCB8920055.1 sulfite exporter TauE/SafE family protein [Ardenticatenaceae bacterium]MCB8989900.1 sulfite exporter TauE/SafE family protein [Ardenticatenaceae bacterium]